MLSGRDVAVDEGAPMSLLLLCLSSVVDFMFVIARRGNSEDEKKANCFCSVWTKSDELLFS